MKQKPIEQMSSREMLNEIVRLTQILLRQAKRLEDKAEIKDCTKVLEWANKRLEEQNNANA